MDCQSSTFICQLHRYLLIGERTIYGPWIQIRSSLNVAVNRALADAGIEIPFPQRDLHLRSVSTGVGEALRASEEPSRKLG